jgi:hypothetical protein
MGFIVLCFIAATITRQQSLQITRWLLFGIVLCVCMAYFFLNQI